MDSDKIILNGGQTKLCSGLSFDGNIVKCGDTSYRPIKSGDCISLSNDMKIVFVAFFTFAGCLPQTDFRNSVHNEEGSLATSR